MNTVKIKTSELEGAALDWAVAKAVYGEPKDKGTCFRIYSNGEPIASIWKSGGTGMTRPWQPSTDWSQGGQLIHQFGVEFEQEWEGRWLANTMTDGAGASWYAEGAGSTHLIAACRAIVAAKLGETVDVPGELL